jgi:hypothetical protein
VVDGFSCIIFLVLNIILIMKDKILDLLEKLSDNPSDSKISEIIDLISNNSKILSFIIKIILSTKNIMQLKPSTTLDILF